MGPICSALLDRKIEFEEIYQVDEFLKSIVKREIIVSKNNRDFWVDSSKLLDQNQIGSACRFSIYFDNKLKEIDEDEIVEIEMLTDKVIKSQINISAGCNQEEDHFTLAKLAYEITNLTNGLVNYYGDLNIFRKGINEELNGKVYSIEYNNGMAAYLISDTVFLSNWIKHPNFRMIK